MTDKERIKEALLKLLQKKKYSLDELYFDFIMNNKEFQGYSKSYILGLVLKMEQEKKLKSVKRTTTKKYIWAEKA